MCLGWMRRCRLPPFKATGEKEARFYGLARFCPRGLGVRRDAAVCGRHECVLGGHPGAALRPNRRPASSHLDCIDLKHCAPPVGAGLPAIGPEQATQDSYSRMVVIPQGLALYLWEPACRRLGCKAAPAIPKTAA